MATSQIITCDECGARRGDSNHWFAALVTDMLFSVRPLYDVMLAPALYETFSVHLCGADCLARRQSRWLAALSSPTVANTEKENDNPDGNDGDAASNGV